MEVTMHARLDKHALTSYNHAPYNTTELFEPIKQISLLYTT
jgi:hypothetical protein